MSYVDGYVLPVPKKNIAAYKKLAAMAGQIWMEHGALSYKECVAEDMKVKCGLPFPKVFKPKRGEVIVFAYIVFKSRKHRDTVNRKVMNDPRMEEAPKEMPFDFKRMVSGGFEAMVDL